MQKRRMVYGGMATAMVVVLASAAAFHQYGGQYGGLPGAAPVSAPAKSEDEFGSIAQNVVQPKPLSHTKPREKRGETARIVQSPAAQSPVAESEAKSEQPLSAWRRIQEAPAGGPVPTARITGQTDAYALQQRAYAPPMPVEPAPYVSPYQGGDVFENAQDSPVRLVREAPESTFSIDVDTASYAFVRRYLMGGLMPQPNAVRPEEMINYFDYDYPVPEDRGVPFRASVTVTPSPWHAESKLMHIGIKGYDIEKGAEQPDSNLVFLIDVSGSMQGPDRLPLVINSMKLLLSALKPTDTISIVTYAGAAGTVLDPTPAREREKIAAALERLTAGGSTAGADGIREAYALAQENFREGGVNRVILATDGDFNVGMTSQKELENFIAQKRKSGIFLSVLGFGQGNLNDHTMQTLAQNGNGTAAYIDTLAEAQKVLVEEATSTLFPIAKDVKIQVEFNPETVAEYRLVGYETRALAREDFNNDAVDAGDIGAGHAVTAIYEITPAGAAARRVDERRYQPEERPAAKSVARQAAGRGDEYAFLKIRYKLPEEDTSRLITQPVLKSMERKDPGTDAEWAIAVASFAQLLKGDSGAGDMDYDAVLKMARRARGDDPYGYRAEFIRLVEIAKSQAR